MSIKINTKAEPWSFEPRMQYCSYSHNFDPEIHFNIIFFYPNHTKQTLHFGIPEKLFLICPIPPTPGTVWGLPQTIPHPHA